MITDSSLPTPTRGRSFPALCWRAILGGTVASIGIHILLTALGVGGGLAAFTPITATVPRQTFRLRRSGLLASALGGSCDAKRALLHVETLGVKIQKIAASPH